MATVGEGGSSERGDETPTRLSLERHTGPGRAQAAVPATIREGEVLGDRYRVIRRLGKGGMGEVYLAEHIAIGRMVAIKTLSATQEDKPDLARRFMQEARTASKVRHANIVDITDFGHTEAGAPFFVMEYLEGQDLKTLLRHEGALAWPRAREIALQICAALGAAHAQGVVHRDLKPDNVFVVRQGDAEVVKVLDFGIAKSITSDDPQETTQTGVLLGTPEYMSPEQAQDLPLDARSDIYAAGVILYRMVTGRVPFQAKAFMTVLARHIQEPPLPPSQVDPTRPVSPGQERVILRCLAKRPEDRYQSAAELATALRAAEEVSAPRRRWAAPVLALGLAGLVGLAAVAAFAWSGAEQAPAAAVQDEPVPENSAKPAPLADPTPVAPVESEPAAEPPKPEPAVALADVPAVEPPASADEPEPVDPSKTKKQTRPRTEPAKTPKDVLGDADIRAAAASVAGALVECSRHGIPGLVVKVDVHVGESGKVERASAHKPQQGSILGNCVEQAARRARFPSLRAPQDVTLPLRLP